MPLIELPNGEVAEFEEGTPQNVIDGVMAANRPTRKQRVAAGQPRKAPLTNEQKEVRDRTASYRKMDGFGSKFNRSMIQGLTFSLDDELAGAVMAGTKGVYNAFKEGDVSEISKEYRAERDTQRALLREDRADAAGSSLAAEVGGAVINPLGTGARIVGTGAKALNSARLAKAAEFLGTRGPVASGIIAGANQGALNAAGSAEELSDVPGALLTGGTVGGITGGAFGGGVNAASRVVQTIGDALPKNASRTAYSRIASLLESGKMNPATAKYELDKMNLRGGDAMVQDLTPGLRAQAAAISRKPSVPSSNALIERGEQRIQDRRANFGDNVRDVAKMPIDDAMARADSLQGTRRAAGQRDYAEGGVMDEPLEWGDDLDRFFREAPEETNAVLRKGINNMLRQRKNPGKVFRDDDGTLAAIPNLRTMDYMKRAYDNEIGVALKAGRRDDARIISDELTTIKGLLGEANPKYREILATQRDLFQKEEALELGTQTLKRLSSDPRKVLKELNKLEEGQQFDARVGIIDALINVDNKADPVGYFKAISRNVAQRKVLEFAFGGKGKLDKFQRFVDREARAARSDVLTAPGRQSETSRIAMASDDADGGTTSVLNNAMRGYAFGGTIGALSGGVRTLQNISTGTSKFVQDEIAKILLSKGDDLVPKIKEVEAYQKARKASNTRRAVRAAKGGQQLFTGIVGGQ